MHRRLDCGEIFQRWKGLDHPMWTTGAPWVFDIVGGSLVLVTVLVIGGGAGGAQVVVQAFQTDPRIRNYTRVSLGFGCLAISIYVAHFLAWGMKGYGNLLRFALQLGGDDWSWTVSLTLLIWALITLSGLICLRSLGAVLGGALGDRTAIRYGTTLLEVAFFGGLWGWGAFFPVPRYRDEPLLWQLATAANFFLHCLYIGAVVEGGTSLALAWLTAGGGDGAQRLMNKYLTARNAPLYPANPRRRSWWDRR